MKIVCGNCGHIKAQWDNHHNCLKCSSCSRLSTCSTCSTWSEETWILADRHRTHAARKSVMTRKRQNKKKRRLWMGTPLPGVGPIKVASVWTLKVSRVCPPVIDQPVTGQPVTGQPGTGQPVTNQLGTVNQAPVNQALDKISPVNQALDKIPPVNKALNKFTPVNQSRQPGTRHGHPVTGHVVITRHRVLGI